jgi:hypothetical protein
MTNFYRSGLLAGFNYRSSISGLFVGKGYAEKHPDTTVKEKKKVMLIIRKGK